MAQINKPTDYFNTKLYTGDGTDGRGITGVGFQPDWCWFKARNTAYENQVYDVVRGATKRLVTNDTTAEGTQANGLQSFDSDGFTVGNANGTNVNAVTYVSWNWLADNTSGSSNTDGSITSTVSANTTSGFSIVSYTGTGSNATIGHGLSSAPAFIIFKDRSATKDWFVYHQSISPATGGKLNLTVNPGADSSYFQNTATTSSVFSVGSANTVNPSGNNMIAYCFAEKKGFSKFGSYTGNGNSDGTFVYTAFKPAFVIVKNTGALENWHIVDNKINPFNPMDTNLFTNISNAEVTASGSTGYDIDFLANGFKVRTSDSTFNTSGGSYIYMCFASETLVGTNNTPATAR